MGGKSVILFFHKVFSCRIDRNAKERHASVSPISFDDFLPFFRNSNLLGLAQHVGNRGDAMWISQSPTFFTDIFREKKSLLVSPCLFRNEGTRTIGLEIFSHFLTRDNFTDIFKIPHLPLFFSRLCWKEKEEGVFKKVFLKSCLLLLLILICVSFFFTKKIFSFFARLFMSEIDARLSQHGICVTQTIFSSSYCAPKSRRRKKSGLPIYPRKKYQRNRNFLLLVYVGTAIDILLLGNMR